MHKSGSNRGGIYSNCISCTITHKRELSRRDQVQLTVFHIKPNTVQFGSFIGFPEVSREMSLDSFLETNFISGFNVSDDNFILASNRKKILEIIHRRRSRSLVSGFDQVSSDCHGWYMDIQRKTTGNLLFHIFVFFSIFRSFSRLSVEKVPPDRTVTQMTKRNRRIIQSKQFIIWDNQ